MSAGLGIMVAPARSSALIFSSARAALPVMIAPACPMRRPGGALRPTMRAATGLLNSASDVLGGFLLLRAADLADEYDAVGLRVVVEQLEHVDERGAVYRIAADADRGGLSDSQSGELTDGLVGQGPTARDDSDSAGHVHSAGHDAHLALFPGEMIPGQFGPMAVTSLPWR